MTLPATAGPMMRDEWITTEFSAIALTTRPEPTISETKACRAGLSTAETRPRMSTSAKTIQASTCPLSVSSHMASAGTAMSACVWTISRRFGIRSASSPPQAPSRRIGRNWSAAVRPTATPLPVSETISHISATVCIQLPLIEMTCPANQRR